MAGIVFERIDAWLAAGIIDDDTASRLRAAEAAEAAEPPEPPEATAEPGTAAAAGQPAAAGATPPLRVGAFIAPLPTIPEVFAYLGAGFFLGAWIAFLNRIAGTDRDRAIMLGMALAAAVLIAAGVALRGNSARARRGAGVAFLAATFVAVAAADAAGRVLSIESFTARQVLDGAAALAVGAAGRWLVTASTTHLALLGSVTVLGAAILDWLKETLFEPSRACCPGAPPPDDILRAVGLPAVGWLAIAVVIGVIGLVEAQSDDEDARRRSTVSRIWAGLVAVIGVSSAAYASGWRVNGEWGRLLEPAVGDAIVLVLAAGLLERAIRRGSGAFLLAASMAFVVALTDFNFSYLADSTDVGLVIEGVILLAVGFVAGRLRRRLEAAADPDRGPPRGAASAA